MLSLSLGEIDRLRRAGDIIAKRNGRGVLLAVDESCDAGRRYRLTTSVRDEPKHHRSTTPGANPISFGGPVRSDNHHGPSLGC